MKPYSITFHNLHKKFADRDLFNIPELTIESGKCLLLSGINGCGKTTLLKIIAGLEMPDRGEIINNGHKAKWKSAYKQLYKNIIYLHQTPLMFDATVAENISYGMRKLRFSRSSIKQELENALHWADLKRIEHNNARTLSGGEKQRVALARAYVLKPKILLLDEAFANLDTDGRLRTFEQVCKLKEEGIGIILTSHEPNMFMTVTDNHLQLENGLLTILKNESVTSSRNIVSPHFNPAIQSAF